MPDILFSCRSCRQDLVVDASGASLTIACPGCGQPVKVPSKGDTGVIRVPEADALRSRVSELEVALSAERRRAVKAEASLKSLSSRWEGAEQTTKKTAAESQKRLRELQDGLALSRQETVAARAAAGAFETERDQIRTTLGQVTGELGQSRSGLEDSEQELKRLRSKLGERDAELRAAEARLKVQGVETEQQQLDAVHALEAIGNDREKVMQERDALLIKMQGLEGAISAARHRQDALQKTLNEEEEKTLLSEQQKGELKELLEQSQARLGQLTGTEEALSELRSHYAEATARSEYLQHEVKRLEDDHAQAQGDLTERSGQVNELETRLRASESEREELILATSVTEHDVELLQRNRDLAAHRDRLMVELAEAQAALLRTETQLYHAMSAREGLAEMVSSLRANLDDTAELYHNMAATVDTLELEVQRLQAEQRRDSRRQAA